VADILDVLSAVGGLGGLLSIMGLAYWLGRRFAQIDERFKMRGLVRSGGWKAWELGGKA